MYYIDLYPPNENKNVNAKGESKSRMCSIVLVLQFVIYNK